MLDDSARSNPEMGKGVGRTSCGTRAPLQLMVITRSDPSLNLHRLRIEGQLVKVSEPLTLPSRRRSQKSFWH